MFFYAAHGVYTEINNLLNNKNNIETFDNTNTELKAKLYTILLTPNQTPQILQILSILFIQILAIMQQSDNNSIDFIKTISVLMNTPQLTNSDLKTLSKTIQINLRKYYSSTNIIKVIMNSIKDMYINYNNSNTVLYANVTMEIVSIVSDLSLQLNSNQTSLPPFILNLFILQILSFSLTDNYSTLNKALVLIKQNPSLLQNIDTISGYDSLPENTGIQEITNIFLITKI
jgi:hypothetical protein